MSRLTGTTIWFGPNSYGYIGWGLFTNERFENQVYVHYKQLRKKGQRDPDYMELRKNDIVEFEVGEGYYVKGTQALKVDIISYGEGNDKI